MFGQTFLKLTQPYCEQQLVIVEDDVKIGLLPPSLKFLSEASNFLRST
jgi:hypothetical protein